ncbi:MAG: DUF3604 domain-containing protein [Acidobacteria bacterium]|nr:DUF3604 domain-containing protein [Acidobacteriota bacterium]
MILEKAPASLGSMEMLHEGPFVAGALTSVVFKYTAGADGLQSGAKVRVGVPNTGWEMPVPPQQRYWDELVQGTDRRIAPFHPTNTTVSVTTQGSAKAVITVMERMLVPDEDPAFAYWRWWITATVEGGDLAPGDTLSIVYGDRKLGIDGVQVQSFPEDHINVTAYVQKDAQSEFLALGEPIYFDVVSGPASRVNIVMPSVSESDTVTAKISLTDASHCKPQAGEAVVLSVGDDTLQCIAGTHAEVNLPVAQLPSTKFVEVSSGTTWGYANPTVAPASDGLNLYWGDLHAQSEHHVMHSQKKDFRQQGWSKGISCGTLDECYQYGREVSMLDFVAMTDQGACLTAAWEYCQQKVREYHDPGKFVTFKAYEAGAPTGHRNVIYVTDTIEPPMDAKKFNGFHPPVLYDYYRERGDALMIPHHVKTWTDWSFHDPELEPVMEVYSCWGQSESPSREMWNKGMTPGAGAWNAYARGYRMGMMASSDNHVGMPGRSFPGDRQAHTPFKGGLCAVWADELGRENIYNTLKARRCYGTTGARIVVRFSIDGKPMGSSVAPQGETVNAEIEIAGSDALRSVEVIASDGTVHKVELERNLDRVHQKITLPVLAGGFHYLRIAQVDNERAWTSPIFFEGQQ